MTAREMPPTRGARLYKKLLGIVLIAAIVGITLAARTLLTIILDAPFTASEVLWRRVAKHVVMLCAGGILVWLAYRGTRRNLAPPEWLVLLLVLIQWVAILL